MNLVASIETSSSKSDRDRAEKQESVMSPTTKHVRHVQIQSGTTHGRSQRWMIRANYPEREALQDIPTAIWKLLVGPVMLFLARCSCWEQSLGSPNGQGLRASGGATGANYTGRARQSPSAFEPDPAWLSSSPNGRPQTNSSANNSSCH